MLVLAPESQGCVMPTPREWIREGEDTIMEKNCNRGPAIQLSGPAPSRSLGAGLQ